jgi:pyruvate dehydrogenase E2 component (dihydrolipoamide acetyltransferase)
MHPVRVPDLGNFREVPVIEIRVQPGESITRESTLIVLESEKSTLDVPAPFDGVVKEMCVKVGDRVSEGSLVLLLEATDTAMQEAPTAAEISGTVSADTYPPIAAPFAVAAAPIAKSPLFETPGTRPLPFTAASPQVRKFARSLGVDLAEVPPTGANRRVLVTDVERFVQTLLMRRAAVESSPVQTARPPTDTQPAELSAIDFSAFGPVERQPLSRIRKVAGAHLARAWMQIPHVTNFDAADVTDLESFRKQINQEKRDESARLTLLTFLMKASAVTLLEFSTFNASLDGGSLVLKRYCHIGFAVDTPNGLLVPVVRDVDRKGLLEVAREVAALAATARAGKLTLAPMQGGCFSISSLGSIGGAGFTPIINAPEVAILGSAKTDYAPKWDGKQFQPRLMLPLCLSWDHRVLDGAAAARFLNFLSSLLADFRRVTL